MPIPPVNVNGQPFNFNQIADLQQFEPPGFSKALYKIDLTNLWEHSVEGKVEVNGQARTQVLTIYQWALLRVLQLQVALSEAFIGCDEQIRMLLACAIAQEPVLFVGRPGVAKTELAVAFFGGIGLRKPHAPAVQAQGGVRGANRPGGGRAQIPNGDTNKYFEYLLSPFTVPEELFGPLDLMQLQHGNVSRINTNMVTGKMVRGVFLDEIFNASSSILNSLLTLINERRYFDGGMFRDADLRVFIGASNHTPASKYGSGDGFGGSKSGELEAFYDRFTVRLYFPTPQELHPSPMDVGKMYKEISKISRSRFMEKLNQEGPGAFPQIACINDILLLGRILGTIDFPEELLELKNQAVTGLAMGRPSRDICSMSPRKPNKLYPIILADSLLIDTAQNQSITTEQILAHLQKVTPKVRGENLDVFYHIWNYQGDRDRLRQEVDALLR